jgi:DNA polymerase
VLEFYDGLGIERLPLELPEGMRAGKDLTPEEKAGELLGIRELIGDCQRCKLSKGRKHIVFGEGNPDAELMFIGEGPGRDEDAQGKPFVGEAGRLLTRLINRMGFERDEVYIGNIIKCRPPMNRDPEEDEIKTCLPFIRRQVEVIKPKVIMSLGRIAAHSLTGKKTPITKMRGRFMDFGRGIRLMPTFHPAYLLRNPKGKYQVWEDAMKVLDLLGRKPS